MEIFQPDMSFLTLWWWHIHHSFHPLGPAQSHSTGLCWHIQGLVDKNSLFPFSYLKNKAYTFSTIVSFWKLARLYLMLRSSRHRPQKLFPWDSCPSHRWDRWHNPSHCRSHLRSPRKDILPCNSCLRRHTCPSSNCRLPWRKLPGSSWYRTWGCPHILGRCCNHLCKVIMRTIMMREN